LRTQVVISGVWANESKADRAKKREKTVFFIVVFMVGDIYNCNAVELG